MADSLKVKPGAVIDVASYHDFIPIAYPCDKCYKESITVKFRHIYVRDNYTHFVWLCDKCAAEKGLIW